MTHSFPQGQPLERRKVIMRVAGCTLGYYGVVIFRGVSAAVQDAWLAAGTTLAATQPDAFLAPGSDIIAPALAVWSTGRNYLEMSTAGFLAFWCSAELWTAISLMVCHGLGATCYITHWPQRRYPRTFDLCGFSHNLMHIFCFAIFVCGYPYLALLHSKQDAWFGREPVSSVPV